MPEDLFIAATTDRDLAMQTSRIERLLAGEGADGGDLPHIGLKMGSSWAGHLAS
jgi:hypothetical protein